VDKQKTYKTELIIAVITGITGIIIAAMSNWDKIYKPTPIVGKDTPRIVNRPMQNEDTAQYFEDYYQVSEAANYAEHFAKEGWYIKNLNYSTIYGSRETLIILESEGETLKRGYTYKLLIFCRDSTKEFKVKLISADSARKETPAFFIRYDIEYEFPLTDVDIGAIKFQIPDEKYTTRFVYLLVSKKT
jgi:hypothetical protein